MEECQEKCLSYKECFLFSTIALVSDVVNMEETLATRGEHEEVTASIENLSGAREQTAWPCPQNPAIFANTVPIRMPPAGFRKECIPVWKAMGSLSANWRKNFLWILL